MVILNLKLDNVLAFNNFEVNFSYPAKLKTSLICGENLKNVPRFRYKKLNIFVGSNATGKTSLIKVIWKTLGFLSRKEKNAVLSLRNNSQKETNIEIDIALDNENTAELHRFKIKINKENEILVAHNYLPLSTSLSSKDSYENKVESLNNLNYEFKNYLIALENVDYINGWNMVLPMTEQDFGQVHFLKTKGKVDEQDYLNILRNIFTTFDPSIININKSKDSDDAYVLIHENGNKIIVQDGMMLSSIQLLSSGSKNAFNLANMVYSIKHHLNGIYLIDEQFSFVNSDIESALISTMVSLLGDNEQLFITTHNNSILSLGFPFHSFYFLKKELCDKNHEIIISCGSEVENRNNVSAKTIVDNDIFSTAPNVNKIFELGE